MPSVAIEIAPPSQSDVTPPALARALVEACAAAMHDGTCALDSDPIETPPTAVAIVRWDSDERHVHIEVGKRDREEPAWQNRELNFGDDDQRVERWRAAGLTIATLAGELVHARAPDSHVEAPIERTSSTTPREPERRERKTPTERASLAWVDAGGLAGTGLDTGSARFGVWADVGARLGDTRWVGIAGVDFGLTETAPSLSVQWLSGSLGLGATIGGARGPVLEPNLELAIERVRAATSVDGRTDAGSELGFGVRGNAIFVWQLGFLSPLLGVRGWLNAEPIRILVREQYAGTAPRVGGALVIGVRLRLE